MDAERQERNTSARQCGISAGARSAQRRRGNPGGQDENPARFVIPMVSRHIALSRLVASLLLSFLLATMAHAASRDEDEPIRVDARSVEANDKTGTVVYSGDVLVEQGRLSIQADRIEITARKGKTELVRATGTAARRRPVHRRCVALRSRFEKPERRG